MATRAPRRLWLPERRAAWLRESRGALGVGELAWGCKSGKSRQVRFSRQARQTDPLLCFLPGGDPEVPAETAHEIKACNPGATLHDVSSMHESGQTTIGRPSLRPARLSTPHAPAAPACVRAALSHLIHTAPLWKRSPCLHMSAQLRHAPSCSADNHPLRCQPTRSEPHFSLSRLQSFLSLRSRPASTAPRPHPDRSSQPSPPSRAQPQPGQPISRNAQTNTPKNVWFGALSRYVHV